MPSKVLARRDLVERDRNSYRLKPDVSELTDAERSELLELSDAARSLRESRDGAARSRTALPARRE